MFLEQPWKAHRSKTPSYLPYFSCQPSFKLFFPATLSLQPTLFPTADFYAQNSCFPPDYIVNSYTSWKTQLNVTFCVEPFQCSPGKNNCPLHCFPAVLPTGFFKTLPFCKLNSLVNVYLPQYSITYLSIEAEVAYRSMFPKTLTQSQVQSREWMNE